MCLFVCVCVALFCYVQLSELMLELGLDKTSFAGPSADENIWDADAALGRDALGYDAKYSCRWLQTCRRNTLPPFPIKKTKAAIWFGMLAPL